MLFLKIEKFSLKLFFKNREILFKYFFLKIEKSLQKLLIKFFKKID